MNIIIDDKIKESLHVRGKNIITIDFGILSSCWSIMPEVFVTHKNPGDSNKFYEIQIDDITVYINKELILGDEIKVQYPKYASDLAEKEFEIVGATPPRD